MPESRIAGLVALINANNHSNSICMGASPVPLLDDSGFPWITIQEVIDKKLLIMTGPTGMSSSMIQFNCWSPSYETAYACRESLKDLLDNFSGAAGTRTIDSSDHDRDNELYDPDKELHQLITRYHIWWED